MRADIGLIGLAVMGENLAMNMESKGFTVAVYNRSAGKVTDFTEGRAKGKNIIGCMSIDELIGNLKKPRKIIMMVKAGAPVDDLIGLLTPHLGKDDILIDGGNSHFPDTARRVKYVEEKGMLYIGTGISGGEEGALLGPSIMPGGSADAWNAVKPIFQSIAAKAEDGAPCCDWIGSGGAGHFVKMVHNGIEYGDMQLICEAYYLMHKYLGMSCDEMSRVFGRWNKGALHSYLVEITRDILAFKDDDGQPLVDKILDTAGQKGTGKWTSAASLDEGVPLTLISEAVYARYLSSMKDERARASKVLGSIYSTFEGSREEKDSFVKDIGSALLASKIVSYAQGFALLRAASSTYGWNLNCGNIAALWRGGCIIRAAFLGNIREAFDKNPKLENLLLDSYFKDMIDEAQGGWRRVCAAAVTAGVPAPAFTSALSFFDGYRCERLSANLLQAQRDYFGAHTFERVDKPGGGFFHTNWTGKGGATSSSAYLV